MVNQVLLGIYEIPTTIDEPLGVTINMQGMALRSQARVWNKGDMRVKLLILAPRITPTPTPPPGVKITGGQRTIQTGSFWFLCFSGSVCWELMQVSAGLTCKADQGSDFNWVATHLAMQAC